ncbi:MAG TPA: cytosine permease [Bryobacteraceae bacterium]
MLPDYIAKSIPNPAGKRAPWYVNTAPTYAGIFLWIGFYESIGQGTLNRANVGLCLLGLAVAGLLSYALYYYAPAMLGMKTGLPLYVVGSSTFGARGGYLMPGLLMGVLQIGWFAVSTYLASTFILKALSLPSAPATVPFAIAAIAWGYVMAWVGVKGIQYVARVSLALNIVPFLMILLVFLKTQPGVAAYTVAKPEPWVAFTIMMQIVLGFFATAGAAGADFGMNSRNAHDVRMGGFVGIAIAVLYAGGLPLLSIAGARAMFPGMSGYNYSEVLGSIGGLLASVMFICYAVASIPSACFCAFIAGNSFATMLPGVKRLSSTMIGATVAIVLAVTGVAANLVTFFQIVGASFGPICGAMAADYLLAGKKWAGPREGINFAGYGAWAAGFLVGVIPFLPVPEVWKTYSQPATLYSLVTGFVVYIILAKAGLESKPVPAVQRPA